MVPWLYTYAKNPKFCPGGVEENISIEKRINEYKIMTKKTPIIAFDYKASITLFITSSIANSFCGGREKLIREKAEFLFRTLCNEFGCKLVFFLDGPIKDHKMPHYEEKSNKQYDDLQTYFDSEDGIRMKYRNLEKKNMILPIYYDNILSIAKKYGEIRIAFKNENDLDLDKFAFDNEVLAIIAADTDFVIMKGDYQIWIPHTINLEKLTIDCLNKQNVRKALRLKEIQLPIFATLYGNTIIPSEKVKKLFPLTFQHIIAGHICSNYPNGIQSGTDFQQLSKFLYHNGENGLTIKEAQNMIRKSLDSYNITKAEENTIEPEWIREHVKYTNSTFVYVVLNNIIFTISPELIHLYTTHPYSELILKLVRRQMGVVLKDEKNRELIRRRIFYKLNHNEPFKICAVKPHFPVLVLPPLECIVESSDQNYLEHLRKIELLSWLVSPTDKPIDVNVLLEIFKSDYFIPIIILNYFVGEGAFSILEADAVLLAVSKSIELTVEELKKYPEPTNFPARPFYVSNVYAASNYYFLNALIVCGLSNCYNGGNFDGFVFHKIYTDLVNANVDQKTEMLKSIQALRIYKY